MSLLRSHGVVKAKELLLEQNQGDWYYEQQSLGFNYRMTEMQAALGTSQMSRLDEFVAKRHKVQERYHVLLRDLPLTVPYQDPDSYSALHLYPIRIDLNKVTKTHKQIFTELREQGIGVNLHYIPVHTQPYYSNLGFKYGDFPESESYYEEAISIPVYYGMTTEDQDQVVSILKNLLK